MSTNDNPAQADAFDAAIRTLPREHLIALVLLESRRKETIYTCGGCARLALVANELTKASPDLQGLPINNPQLHGDST